MLGNPFLGGGEGLEQSPAMAAAAEQHAQDLAVKQALAQLLQKQMSESTMQAGKVAATGIGQVAKPAVNYLKASLGPTLSSSAAQAANGAVTESATNTGSSLLGAAGSGLGAAALGYGAYQGVESGLGSANKVNQAIRKSRNLEQDEADSLRQSAFNAQMVKGGTGAGSGALGGLALGGPIGAVVGGLAGGAGGFLGATRMYKDSEHPARDTAKAFATFMKNPFKR